MLPPRRPNLGFPEFPLDHYLKSPETVKLANENAFRYAKELVYSSFDEVDALKEQIESKNQQITDLQKMDSVTAFQPLYLLCGTILLGFGINIATASPHELLGWLLCFSGAGVEIVVIFIGLIPRLRKGKGGQHANP